MKTMLMGIALLAALAGCGPAKDQGWLVCDAYAVPEGTFSDAEFRDMQIAANRVDAFVGRREVAVERGDRDTCAIHRTPGPMIVNGVHAGADNDPDTGVIVYADDQSCDGALDKEECFVATFMHEFGHYAFRNRDHAASAGGPAIMNPGIRTADFTAADGDFCRLHVECAASGARP
jgi:hypothetical protein